MAPLIIPPVAFVVGWTFLMSSRVGYLNQLLRLLPWWSGLEAGPLNPYSFPMIVVMTGLILTPFIYLFVLSAMANMSPEYEAAALVSGASERQVFFNITLPMIRPALIYSSGVALLLGLGQFAVPLLLGRNQQINVLTTEMYLLREHYPVNYGLAALLGTPLLVAGLLILFAQQRGLGDARRFVTLSGRSAGHVRAEGGWLSYLTIAVFGIGIIAAPLATLAYVAVSPYWSGQLTLANLTTQHIQAVINDPLTRDAIFRSVRLAAIAGLITMPIGFVAALASLGRLDAPRPIRVVIEAMAMVPLGIPAALLGLGVLFAYTVEPFNLFNSEIVIVVTYVTIMIPFATRALASSLVSIGPEFAEAAQIAGARPFRTFLNITVPLARRGVAGAAALVVILLFHEFAATVMVAGPKNQLMGSVLYKYWVDGSLPRVAVISMIMVIVTTIGVFLALALGNLGVLRRRSAKA
jgi:iron(III) transport system permease protein